jgi:hypothetical protein
MVDPQPTAPQGTPPPADGVAATEKASPGTTINIADEFGTAKRNLPPAATVLLTLLGVLIVVAGVSFLQRAKPQGSGSLDNVTAAEIPNQNATLVALTFTLHNAADKVLWVRSIQGKLKTSAGESTGDALSAVDFDRYFQAFPQLKSGVKPALSPEAKIQPGEDVKRTVIVSFPVSLDNFNQRQSVSVSVQPYDETLPITLTR